MQSIIDLNEIEHLPFESLRILKDDFGKKDMYSLCLRTEEHISSLIDFKISFVLIDTIPICVLMIKLGNKIYKCLIEFEFEKEFAYLKNLMLLNTFNLFLISDTENKVIRIENLKNEEFIKALSKVKENMDNISYHDLNLAKQKLLNMYSDEELWNMDT